MRILHLIHSEGVYGAERVLLYLAREQQRLGHVPIVGSIRDPDTGETPFEALAASWGLQVKRIRVSPRPTPGVVRSILRTTRELELDVLHSHGYKANILLGPLPRSWRGPMLTTLHGWTQPPRLSALWLYHRLDRLALRRIDSLVVVARHMLTTLQGLPGSRVRVIENGIPPLAARLKDFRAFGMDSLPQEVVEFVIRRPTLVAIGRLSREKGFGMLVEAFARAREQLRSEHQLLIVGEGPERPLLASRIAGLGLAGFVRLPGYVAGADRLLEQAAGFVMSSLTEGLPLALIEAMQWRVPILATAVGDIPELLEGGQYWQVVEPNEVTAITRGLRDMMSKDPVPHEMHPRTSERVLERYSSARMTHQYLNAYQAVSEGRS
jgi:glycosyltransferase involved in cell wall biosynthesis